MRVLEVSPAIGFVNVGEGGQRQLAIFARLCEEKHILSVVNLRGHFMIVTQSTLQNTSYLRHDVPSSDVSSRRFPAVDDMADRMIC